MLIRGIGYIVKVGIAGLESYVHGVITQINSELREFCTQLRGVGSQGTIGDGKGVTVLDCQTDGEGTACVIATCIKLQCARHLNRANQPGGCVAVLSTNGIGSFVNIGTTFKLKVFGSAGGYADIVAATHDNPSIGKAHVVAVDRNDSRTVCCILKPFCNRVCCLHRSPSQGEQCGK